MYTYQFDISSFLHVCLVSIHVFFTILYAFKNYKKSLFHRLITLYFILISYCTIVIVIVLNDMLIYFPYIARTGSLILLLFNPIFYFALEKGIFKRKLFSKDLLQFIPAVIYLINFFPFFIKNNTDKIALIKKTTSIEFSEGWIFPKYFIPALLIFYVTFYSIIIYNQFIKKELKSFTINLQTKIKVLWVFNSFQIIPLLLIIFGYVESEQKTYIDLIYILGNISFLIYFFYNPIIIKFKENKIRENKNVKNDLSKSLSNPFDLQKIILIRDQLTDIDEKIGQNQQTEDELTKAHRIQLKKIIDFMAKNTPFLKDSFSQQTFAKDLGISTESIRTILNIVYNMTFSEYKNYFRILYLVDQITNNSIWSKYSIEVISKELGYKTSNALYINCKKFTGLTPRQLLDELQ